MNPSSPTTSTVSSEGRTSTSSKELTPTSLSQRILNKKVAIATLATIAGVMLFKYAPRKISVPVLVLSGGGALTLMAKAHLQGKKKTLTSNSEPLIPRLDLPSATLSSSGSEIGSPPILKREGKEHSPFQTPQEEKEDPSQKEQTYPFSDENTSQSSPSGVSEAYSSEVQSTHSSGEETKKSLNQEEPLSEDSSTETPEQRLEEHPKEHTETKEEFSNTNTNLADAPPPPKEPTDPARPKPPEKKKTNVKRGLLSRFSGNLSPLRKQEEDHSSEKKGLTIKQRVFSQTKIRLEKKRD